jgi:hypothetical protein
VAGLALEWSPSREHGDLTETPEKYPVVPENAYSLILLTFF